jgi:hypothetical protein
MTPRLDAEDRGSALVAVTHARAVPRSTEVVGTVHMVDGELVVHLQPSGVREATTRRLPRDPDPQPTTLAALPFMRYVGPLTADQAAQCRADVARRQARRQRSWRRWWR